MAAVCGETHNHLWRVTLESHPWKLSVKGHRLRSDGLRFRGAADGTRTRNRQLGRLLLYQLNYRRKCQDNFYRSEGPFSELPTPVRSRIWAMLQTVKVAN